MITTNTAQEKIRGIVRASPEGMRNPMRFVREAVSALAFESMGKSMLSCHACSSPCRYRRGYYIEKPEEVSLMVILDYPSERQNTDKKGFFGGIPEIKNFLDKTFHRFGADPGQVLYMNTVCGCMERIVGDKRGSGIYRPPTQREIENCSTFVKFAIDAARPPMIVLMGNVALNVFRKETIKKARGTWTSVHAIPAMATYSPSYLLELRGQIDESERMKMFKEFHDDIEKAVTKYRRDWPNSKFFT